MKLLLPTEYVAQAAELVRNAQKRVFLISMVMADHPNTNELLTAAKEAAQRGVDVNIAADIFTFGEINGSFLPIRYYSPGSKETNSMVKVMKKAGVRFHWLGRGRITIFNGRTHSKWCVVDDTVFCFGGVNLYDGGIDNVDYMFRIEDSKLANRITEEQLRIQKAERKSGNYPSVAVEQDNFKILIDGGIIGQSVIYRRACELALEAEKIIFVSQYCPTGKLARILNKKKHKKLYYNKAVNITGLNRIVNTVSQFLSGLPSSYRKKRYLHAKFIIFTMPDGTKKAITGSHNFAYTGVLLGTREIALETADLNVINQLEDFIDKRIA
ncbi:MAG: phospholipase D-like domain-containing protein [Candidatus Microsaccharimonas sp.]